MVEGLGRSFDFNPYRFALNDGGRRIERYGLRLKSGYGGRFRRGVTKLRL